ncbi:hypothetical protein OROHE_023632 [Orobanche hederae]
MMEEYASKTSSKVQAKKRKKWQRKRKLKRKRRLQLKGIMAYKAIIIGMAYPKEKVGEGRL